MGLKIWDQLKNNFFADYFLAYLLYATFFIMEINLIAKFLHNKTKGYELRANKYSVFFYIFINEMIIAFRNINPIYFMEIIADKIEALLPKKKLDIFGKNSLLHNTFPYYLLASMILLGHFGEGENVFMFIFVIYTVLPLLD